MCLFGMGGEGEPLVLCLPKMQRNPLLPVRCDFDLENFNGAVGPVAASLYIVFTTGGA